MEKKFILSVLTVCLAACSGGGSSSPATTTSGTPSQFIIAGQTYDFQSSALNVATDSTYVSPQLDTQLFANENKYAVKPASAKYQQDIETIFQLTNQYRAEKGLSPLVYDANLMAYAQKRAEELTGVYSHTRPDGTNFDSGLTGGGAENISFGQASGEAAIVSWRNSPSHYENIIYPNVTKIGIGVVYSPSNGLQWVQVLGFDATTSEYHFDETLTKRDTFENSTAKLSSNSEKLKYLIVDNFPIHIGAITPNGQWHGFSQSNSAESYSGMINGYNDSRFGLVKSQNGNYQSYYTGNETAFANMPTTGVANYTGAGIITDGSAVAYLNAQFQADFSNKKLSGALSKDGEKVVDVQAHIDGKAFRSPTNATVETEGVFFGSKAEELGGVFYNHSTNQYGAFGAKQ